MNKSFDCVVVGSCVVDVLARPVPLAEPIGRGRLIESEPLRLTTGGIVSNAGITMARLGLRVAAFTYIGRDEWAEVIRHRYAAEGIDTSHLMEHPTQATSTSAVLIDPTGERSFVHCAGAPRRSTADAARAARSVCRQPGDADWLLPADDAAAGVTCRRCLQRFVRPVA